MVNDTIEKKEIEEKKNKKNKKLPKDISQEILNKMFKSLLRAIGIMLYFIILNLAYSSMKQERLIGDIEVFASVFLVIGIIFLEKAYKKDNGSIAISGIEFLVLSLHSLSIMHIITLYKYDFRFYLLTSSYIFSIYYVLKAIVLYTKGRKQYLNSLSDISEIVKKDEPIKKEAKKSQKVRTEDKTIKKETKKSQKENAENEPIKKETKKSQKENAENEPIKKETKKSQKVRTEDKTIKKETKKIQKAKTEEIKVPEKKKRGRPKKEVIKND